MVGNTGQDLEISLFSGRLSNSPSPYIEQILLGTYEIDAKNIKNIRE